MRAAFRRFKHRRRIARALAELRGRACTPHPHGLSTPLIVSLTSYPPRFALLPQTLRCLLRQSCAADRTILWIAHDDWPALTPEILALQENGLEILPCDDLRSYNKILSTLEIAPDATIITADDDVYYGPDWVQSLVTGHIATGAGVVCLRAHGITLDPSGAPRPYADWQTNIAPAQRRGTVFPTGVSGVLYAPGSLDPRAGDWATANALCPTADDVWLYWMHRMTGGAAHHIEGARRILEWTPDPSDGLRQINASGGNDAAIRAMIARYGFPPL